MYTKELWITYRCSACHGSHISTKRYIDPTSIDNIDMAMNSIQPLGMKTSERCALCGNVMCMTHLECEIMPGMTKYGIKRDGHWECCLGHVEDVYPIPLKRMDTQTGFVRYHNDKKYELVVNGGYPWKCPVCKRYLTYVMDKRY